MARWTPKHAVPGGLAESHQRAQLPRPAATLHCLGPSAACCDQWPHAGDEHALERRCRRVTLWPECQSALRLVSAFSLHREEQGPLRPPVCEGAAPHPQRGQGRRALAASGAREQPGEVSRRGQEPPVRPSPREPEGPSVEAEPTATGSRVWPAGSGGRRTAPRASRQLSPSPESRASSRTPAPGPAWGWGAVTGAGGWRTDLGGPPQGWTGTLLSRHRAGTWLPSRWPGPESRTPGPPCPPGPGPHPTPPRPGPPQVPCCEH